MREKEAVRMLDVFASVGATAFDLTHINIDGEKRGFRKAQTLQQITTSMPYLLESAGKRQNNVIVRPHSTTAQLIQLDDLDTTALDRVKQVAFLTLCTSPGNHQAWVSVNGADADFARRLRKGTGADLTASGATRVAGTLNYKRKYEPDFPTVTILDRAAGRIVTPAQLESLGLVAPPEPVKKVPDSLLRVSRQRRSPWPDYQRCVDGAPPNHGKTGPDISRADFTWCMTAISWGRSEDETAAKLMELSIKAQENGERYAQTTAQNAAAAADRNQKRSRA
jgi:hypothetical protein